MFLFWLNDVNKTVRLSKKEWVKNTSNCLKQSLYLFSRLSVVIPVALSNQCLCVLLLNFSNRNQYRLLLK